MGGLPSGGTTTGGAATGGAAVTGGIQNATGGAATGGATGGAATGGAATGGAATGGATTGGSDTGGASATGGIAATGGADTTGGSESTGGLDGGSGGASGGDSSTGGDSGADPRSPGCGTAFPNPPPSNQQQTLEIAGDTRYYLLDVPDSADNETPLMLVFGLHGYDMNNVAVVGLFNFTERSNGQAITVWPQGEGPPPGDVSHWGDGVLQSTWTANENNYTFLREIMTSLGERYCIDQSRIFIAGFSMGGFFTNQIACVHSEWFRGFAPVAGGGPQGCADDGTQSAIMLQHGTADPIVDPTSGEASRDFWLDRNGCSQSSTSSLNNCQFYDGCAEGKPVAWCTGNYDHYIPNEAASNIWSFFSSL